MTLNGKPPDFLGAGCCLLRASLFLAAIWPIKFKKVTMTRLGSHFSLIIGLEHACSAVHVLCPLWVRRWGHH